MPPLPRVAGHFRRLLRHRQVTDAYLVAVAETHGATLLTLDRRILVAGVARASVEVLTA
jgi:predicted nucleic acid-binding protein